MDDNIEPEQQPLKSFSEKVIDGKESLYPRELSVPCYHARSRYKLINDFLEWLLCWQDPYEVDSSNALTVFIAIWGLGATFLDMGTDTWVAVTHFIEGHFVWAVLTITFVLLPCVFTLVYTVWCKGYYKWFQVHPFGPVYWAVKSLNAMKKESQYRLVKDETEATWYVHYTHKAAHFDQNNQYSSAYENYLESVPELIVQGYFIARIMMHIEGGEIKKEDEVDFEMWFSIIISGLSAVVYESSVSYHRHFVTNDQIFEPCWLDVIFKMGSDLMVIFPRVTTIACLFTVSPQEIIIPVFLGLHMVIAYTFFHFANKPQPSDAHCQASREEFRGYKSNRSRLINNLRSTVVSFLFPPTCGWHEKNIEFRSWRKVLFEEIQITYVIISTFQVLESAGMFSIWLYFNRATIREPFEFVVPIVAVGFLILRPFFDLIGQITILSPLDHGEEQHCPKFLGLLAKTRILQMGADLYGSFNDDLLPRLIHLERLFSKEISDVSKVKIQKICHWIYTHFSAENIVKSQKKELYQATLVDDEMVSHPGPKNELLLTSVGVHDVQIFEDIMLAAQKWYTVSDSPQQVVKEIQKFIILSKEKAEVWRKVFAACLTFQKLPLEFAATSKIPNANHRIMVEAYDRLIELNKECSLNNKNDEK